ncbi:hypothetical protein O0L34_g594 [Tuta absoluta]|nr:hypothetical protein O0L34_g594 [Tuta absoluta]
MTAEKMSQQPPPLVRTNTNKVSKPPHKLVRLAPLSSKLGQAAMSRGGQSLLAPLTAMSGDALPARVTDELDKPEELMHHPPALLIHPSAEQIHPPAELNHPPAELHYPPAELHHHQPNVPEEAQDSKSALRALIADTVGLEYDSSQDSLDQHNNTTEIQVEFDKSGQDLDESSSSVERGGVGGGGAGGGGAGGELPLIVIPQHFVKQEAVPSKQNNYDVSQRLQQVQVEVDVGGPYDYQALLSERADQPSPDPGKPADVSQRLQQVQVEVDVGGPYDYQALLSERADQPSPDPGKPADVSQRLQQVQVEVDVGGPYDYQALLSERADQPSPDPGKPADVSQRLQQVQVEVDVGGPYDYQALLSERADQPSPDPDMMSSSLGGVRPRKACNCTKSQCLKLYCDCFANGEFCNRCNCNNCHNNLDNEELRQKAIRGCLDRNPNAFRPKIGKAKISGADHFRRHNKGCNCKRSGCLKNYCECYEVGLCLLFIMRISGADHFRRHNKGCNCKRSGCLKNYCECYEAKIACTNICKCVGCRNVEESVERARRRDPVGLLAHQPAPGRLCAPPLPPPPVKQPCSFMTSEVIEAVCQCLIAAAVESGREGAPEGGGGGGGGGAGEGAEHDPVRDVIEEFARCLQDIISASHHPPEMQA